MPSVTLKQLADSLGCSHQAVAQRFQTKDGLLRAYFTWMRRAMEESTRATLADSASSVDRLRRLLTLPIGRPIFEPDTAEMQASWRILALELRRDPVIGKLFAQMVVEYRRTLTGLVQEGQAAGEIIPGSAEEIAELAQVAATGAAMQWLLTQQEPLLSKLERCIDLALRPYIIRPKSV